MTNDNNAMARAGFKIDELVSFILKAKVQAYAGEGRESPEPERPSFKELIFSEGSFTYVDSYAGFFMAPGQEVVRFKDIPVWAMSYSGGMCPEHRDDIKFAKQTFQFLKKCLSKVPKDAPFRGPKSLVDGDYEYVNEWKGELDDFVGSEKIYFKKHEVFSQNYMGGLIIHKFEGAWRAVD